MFGILHALFDVLQILPTLDLFVFFLAAIVLNAGVLLIVKSIKGR